MTTTASYVTDALYEELTHFARDARSDTGPADPALRPDVEGLLFHEARLLDLRRFDEWLELFTDDCIYWVPSNPEIGDPRTEVSYTLDDRRRLEDRVARLRTGWAHSQTPPSRTCRTVSNVEVWDRGGDERRARCTVVVWDWRREVQSAHAAHQEYRLRRQHGTWRIVWKIVGLVNSDGALGNISYIV
jgi:benzoate/toluate 1,2-dioxygenase beta subunit